MGRFVLQLLDRILVHHPEEEQFVNRIAVSVALLAVVLVLVATLVHIANGLYAESLVSALLMMISAGLLIAVRTGTHPRWIGWILGLSIIGLGSFNSYQMGGIIGPPLITMGAAVMLASLISGARAGWLMCVLLTVELPLLAMVSEGDPALIREQTFTLLINVWLSGLLGAAFTSLRDRAEAASRSKTAFLANMSHEIRTPLNGVLGMLGLVLDDKLDASQRNRVITARASGQALLNLLNDILDLSKVEAGQLELEPSGFDLRRVVEEVIDQTALSSTSSDIEYIMDFHPGTPSRVIGDAGRVRQVLLNLVNNARKFTTEGHVAVEVDCTSRDDGIARIRLEVQDTGIGIDPTKRETIFQKFRQADASTTRMYGGTGLGLTITRELVQMMDGEVSLHSSLDIGSTFTLTIPFPIESDDDPIPEAVASLSGLRVLLVERHPVRRTALDRQLTHWDFAVTPCETSDEALKEMSAAAQRGVPWDLVLLDHQLSGKDDLTTAEAIRSESGSVNTPVIILMTSTAGTLDSSRLQDLRIAGTLTKPIRRTALADIIATAWQARQQSKTVPLIVQSTIRARRTPQHHYPHLAGTRVLVVEDNPVNQRVAAGFLERLGCRADVAGNGLEAVTQAQAAPYEIILMDVQMPVMDGFAATEAIRRWETETERASVPIIAMTAHAMRGDKERCIEAGMDGYLSKPVSLRTVAEALERILPARSTATDGAAKVAAGSN